jgi:hypothetical protein
MKQPETWMQPNCADGARHCSPKHRIAVVELRVGTRRVLVTPEIGTHQQRPITARRLRLDVLGITGLD